MKSLELCFNIKIIFQALDSLDKNKTTVRPCYRYNENKNKRIVERLHIHIKLIPVIQGLKPWLNIKIIVVKQSYLYNGNPYTDKTVFSYRDDLSYRGRVSTELLCWWIRQWYWFRGGCTE